MAKYHVRFGVRNQNDEVQGVPAEAEGDNGEQMLDAAMSSWNSDDQLGAAAMLAMMSNVTPQQVIDMLDEAASKLGEDVEDASDVVILTANQTRLVASVINHATFEYHQNGGLIASLPARETV
jgi:hypothetical protein